MAPAGMKPEIIQKLDAAIARYDRAGLQVELHAIGDRFHNHQHRHGNDEADAAPQPAPAAPGRLPPPQPHPAPPRRPSDLPGSGRGGAIQGGEQIDHGSHARAGTGKARQTDGS